MQQAIPVQRAAEFRTTPIYRLEDDCRCGDGLTMTPQGTLRLAMPGDRFVFTTVLDAPLGTLCAITGNGLVIPEIEP